MSFNKRTWEGRTGTGLNKYIISEEDGAGKRTITSMPDRLITVGDAVSADNLNDLEDRIDLAIQGTGYKVILDMNPSTFVLTPKLYDINNNLISTGDPIDLPLETMVVDARYDSQTQSIIITLKNGTTTSFSIAALVNGLVSTSTFETHTNDDTRHFTTGEKQAIANIPTKATAIAHGDQGYATGQQVFDYIDENVGNNVHLSIVNGKLNVTFAVEEYDSTRTYEFGDFCIYDVVKTCIADTTGTFDPDDWEDYFDDYDPDQNYIVGDYCNYNNETLVCIADTTGVFDSTKWHSL